MSTETRYTSWTEDHVLNLWGATPLSGINYGEAQGLLDPGRPRHGGTPTDPMILVGVACGLVEVRISVEDRRPEEPVDTTADALVEASLELDGQFHPAGYEGEMDEGHEGLALTGIYRIRVSAYGRNAIWDDAFGPDDPPQERYDFVLWPEPAADAASTIVR